MARALTKVIHAFSSSFLQIWTRSGSSSLPSLEAMYWKIVEEGDMHVAVQYGSDIDTTLQGRCVCVSATLSTIFMIFFTYLVSGCPAHPIWSHHERFYSSGFPTDPRDPYSKFGWNLNVLPGLPESILKHVKGISGTPMVAAISTDV